MGDQTAKMGDRASSAEKRNFNGRIVMPQRVLPESQEELIEMMRTRNAKKIVAVGRFSSFAFPHVVLKRSEESPHDSMAEGQLADPGAHVVVDMSNMNKVLSIDAERNLVTFEAGISYEDLVHNLKEHGLAVENLSAYPKVSVGGAAGTGTHGSGTKILSDQFLSMEVVDAKGQLHTIDDPKCFTHLGVLGIVSTITLRCVPLFFIKQSCYAFDTWDMAKQKLFQDEAQMNKALDETFSMMLRISFKDDGHPTQLFLRQKVTSKDDDEHAPTFLGAPLLLESRRNTYGGKVTSEKTTFTACYDEVLADHSTASEHSSAPVNYAQAEYFMDLDGCSKAIDALLKESRKDGLFTQLFPSGCKFRFVKADEQHMSPCANLDGTKDFIGFQYSIYGNLVDVDTVLKRTEEAFASAPMKFTSHWGKLTHGGQAKINACFKERAKLFNETRRALDPNDCFLDPMSEVGKLLFDGSSGA